MSVSNLCDRMLSLGYYLNDGVFYNQRGDSMTLWDAEKYVLELVD
jgi:hypothetical protein